MNEPIDREVTGAPVSAHGYIVTPFARIRGRQGATANEGQSSAYALIAARPVKMSVQDGSGSTKEVLLTNIEAQVLAAMGAVALGVAIAGLLIPRLRKNH